MKKTLILSLLFLPFIFSSCGPDGFLNPKPSQVDTLPPITTEGLQTFGYKVNGEVVRYDNQSARYINLDYIPNDSTLYFYLESDRVVFTLKQTGVFKTETLFKSGNLESVQYSFRNNPNEPLSRQYYNVFVDGGGQVIELESEVNQNIVSGTFWCTLINRDNPKDTVRITEGRFDLIEN